MISREYLRQFRPGRPGAGLRVDGRAQSGAPSNSKKSRRFEDLVLDIVPTYGDLLLNPCWDNVRGDKRFDKITAAAKAASR
jgi:hypothetical protein